MNFIYPNWKVPKNIHALTTTRQGGVSKTPYDSLNLGSHVGDDLNNVVENRFLLTNILQIQNEPIWLNQTHSTRVIDLSNYHHINADGSYTNKSKQICTILTADCLPVLFCSKKGDEIAAAHAGWRGLCNGILEETIRFFHCLTSEIVVWLGPAIGPKQFEVGKDVKDQFEKHDPKASIAFQLIDPIKEKYLANLYLLAKLRLSSMGINQIYGGDHCTYTQSDLFYSYRRENKTGRIASLIWFD